MQAKQTVVGHTKRLFGISVLILAVAVTSVLFATYGKSATVFAACTTGSQGVNGNVDRPDSTKCYDSNNKVVGNADGTPITPTTPAGQTTTQTGTTTCAIQKVGWILCPIITESGKISDYAFGMLANNFLSTEPELIATSANGAQPSGTMFAWNQARNLANIMFIIAFLIIIISQITGYGVSNYGIKKMIPRLVIAAIAVNLSYYICQALVDITNILGFALENMLVEAGNTISSQSAMPISAVSATQTGGFDNGSGSGNVLTTIALVAVAGVAIYPLLGLLFASIGMILFICVAIIFILLMRKAIIVLLVVVSPIAFVLYLLPNTEKLFSKWLHMFWQLLLVFPIVGLLLGGGQLASKIILVAGAQQTPASTSANDPQCVTLSAQGQAAAGNCQPGAVSLSLGLVAAGVAAAPLFATYAVLKGALNSAGAIGGKISGQVQGLSGRLGKAAQDSRLLDKSAIGRGMAARKAIRSSYSDRQFYKRANSSKWRGSLTRLGSRGVSGNLGYLANKTGKEIPLTGAMRAEDTLIRGQFSSAAEKIQDEEVKASMSEMHDKSMEDMINIVNGGTVDDPKVAAAIKELIDRQDFPGIEAALDKFGNQHGLASRTLGHDLGSTDLFTGGQLGAISQGHAGGTYADIVNNNIKDGIFSPEKISTAGPALLNEASRLATSQEARNSLMSSATTALNDPILSTKISRNRNALTAFQSGHASHDISNGENIW